MTSSAIDTDRVDKPIFLYWARQFSLFWSFRFFNEEQGKQFQQFALSFSWFCHIIFFTTYSIQIKYISLMELIHKKNRWWNSQDTLWLQKRKVFRPQRDCFRKLHYIWRHAEYTLNAQLYTQSNKKCIYHGTWIEKIHCTGARFLASWNIWRHVAYIYTQCT